MKNRVLVTGGSGYIGSHTCKALAQQDFVPITIDNLSRGERANTKWGPLHVVDIRDTSGIVAMIRAHDIGAVIHFAAYAYVGESITDPDLYYDVNVIGTRSLLNAMRETGLSEIIFSSSCAVYGAPNRMPIDEAAPTVPLSPYGRSKLIGEQMLADFGRGYGIKSIALRYFNAAGDDPDGEIGELREHHTRLVPRAILNALGRINDFEVFGSDFPTSDGTAIRDYIHVSDLADAHVLALKALKGRGQTGIFNLGVGRGYSVLEILKAVGEISGRPVDVPRGAKREGDPPAMVADGRRARDVLGFVPRFSDLRTIIDTSWRWHSTH